jgi:putative hydrolase of the HAD superfamily
VASNIELVVFDMDDVLAKLDRPKRLQRLAEMTGKTPELLHETIWASDFEPAAEAGAFESGEAYLAELNRRLETSLTRAQWIEARGAAMITNLDTIALADRLRRDCAVAMLTNNGALLREALPELLPDASGTFGELAFASCQLKARKPEAAVFLRLLERCGVAAPHAVLSTIVRNSPPALAASG